MLILGIDPGSLITGYGVVEVRGGRMRRRDSGRVRADARRPLAERLLAIHAGVRDVIAAWGPDEVAVEALFNARNARSSLILGHARGVVLLAAAEGGRPVAEYAPREVRKAVTGQGAATKEQARFMVCRYLGLAQAPASLDESDALAVAVCHALRAPSPASARQREVGR